MGRWGGTGPDSGAEGPLGSARESETELEGLRGAASHYPFSLSNPQPSKLTATQLKGRSLDQGDPGGGRPAVPPDGAHPPAAPVLWGGTGLTPPSGHSPPPGHAVPGHGYPRRTREEAPGVRRSRPATPPGAGPKHPGAVRLPLGRNWLRPPQAGVQVFRAGAADAATMTRLGRGRGYCSRAWWTAILEERHSRWCGLQD